MLDLKDITKILREKGLPAGHAETVLELLNNEEISLDDFYSLVSSPEIRHQAADYDCTEAIKNYSPSTTISETHAQEIVQRHRTGDCGYLDRRRFHEILDDWVMMEWEESNKEVTPGKYFIQKHSLDLTEGELNGLLTGTLAPNDALLQDLCAVLPHREAIGCYRWTFASAAHDSMEKLPLIDYHKTNKSNLSFAKQVITWMAIGNIKNCQLKSIMGLSDSSRTVDFTNGNIDITPSRVESIINLFSSRIPNFSSEHREELMEAALPHFSKVKTISSFKDALIYWRDICELSPSEFCSEVSKIAEKSNIYPVRQTFNRWADGKGLSPKILESIVKLIEDKTKKYKYTCLQFNDEDKQQLYTLSKQYFIDETAKDFKSQRRMWTRISGMSVGELAHEVGMRVIGKPYSKSMLSYKLDNGRRLTREIAEALCDIFSERTKSNDADFLRFGDDEREALMSSARIYFEQPEAGFVKNVMIDNQQARGNTRA